MGLTFENGQLLATTSIAALAPDGQSLRMPASTEYVLMEIGCSDWDTLDETDLDQHRGRGFLISFEPLLDKYAVLLARGNTRYHGMHGDMAVPLAHHHQHGVVLPLAVSPTGGAFNITVHEHAGCSSLLAPGGIVPYGPCGQAFPPDPTSACRTGRVRSSRWLCPGCHRR